MEMPEQVRQDGYRMSPSLKRKRHPGIYVAKRSKYPGSVEHYRAIEQIPAIAGMTVLLNLRIIAFQKPHRISPLFPD